MKVCDERVEPAEDMPRLDEDIGLTGKGRKSFAGGCGFQSTGCGRADRHNPPPFTPPQVEDVDCVGR